METATDEAWLPLSRWSIAHFLAKDLYQLISSGWALIPAGIGVGTSFGSEAVVAGGAVLFAVTCATAIIQHRFFRYRLTAEQVQVRSGMLNKREVNLTYPRIQNVQIIHPFYFRPLGLVTVRVDGAGSSAEEVSLAALTIEDGEALRADLLARRGEPRREDTAEAAPLTPEAGSPIITRAVSDLVMHGLSSNRIWVLGALAAGVFGQSQELIGPQLEAMGVDLEEDIDLAALGLGVALLVIALSLLGILVLVTTLSVIGAIVLFHGYQLFHTGDGFTANFGLLTRRELHVKKSRVQTVVFRQNWIDRLFERVNLIFEQISHSEQQAGGRQDKRLLVPSLKPAQALDVAHVHDIHLPNPYAQDFCTPDRRYFTRSVLLLVTFVLSPAVLAVAYGAHGIASALTLLFALLVAISFGRYRRLGIAWCDDYVIVRRGLIGTVMTVLPAYKLQSVAMQDTPFTRRVGLSRTLILTMASGVLTMPYLKRAQAWQFADRCLFEVEHAPRPWM